MKKIFFVMLFLSSIIFGYSAGMDIFVSREIILKGFIVFLTMNFLYKQKFNKLIIAFLGWAFITHLIHYNPRTVMSFNNVYFYTLLYYIILKTITERDIERVFNVICLASMAQAIYVGVQLLGKDVLFVPKYGYSLIDATVGFLGNRNHLAAFIAITVPCFFRKKWIYGLIIVLPPLLLTHTRGGVISLFFGVMFWLWMNRKYSKMFILGLSMLLFWSVTPMESSRYEEFKRIVFVSDYVRIDKNNSVMVYNRLTPNAYFGHGIGNFYIIYPQAQKIIWDTEMGYDKRVPYVQAHNEYLQVKFGMGYVGLLIAVCFIFSIINMFIDVREDTRAKIIMSSITIILISSAVNFNFHVAGIVWTILANFIMLEVIYNGREENNGKNR